MKSQPIIYFLLLFIWFTQYSLLIAFIICTLSCTCAHTCTHLCMLAFECLTGMNEVPSGESGCGRCWGDATGPRPCFSLRANFRSERWGCRSGSIPAPDFSVLCCFMGKNETLSRPPLTGLFHGWTSIGPSVFFISWLSYKYPTVGT